MGATPVCGLLACTELTFVFEITDLLCWLIEYLILISPSFHEWRWNLFLLTFKGVCLCETLVGKNID